MKDIILMDLAELREYAAQVIEEKGVIAEILADYVTKLEKIQSWFNNHGCRLPIEREQELKEILDSQESKE